MFDATYTQINSWTSGFQGEFKLTNTGNGPERGWQLSFSTPVNITQIWGAKIVSHVGDVYVVENLSWNRTLAPGQQATIGFIANPSGPTAVFTDIMVNGEPVGDPGDPALPILSIADAVVNEKDGHASVTVSLDTASDAPVTVSVATVTGSATSADFTAVNTTVTFAPGETSATVHIPVTDDELVEENEIFRVRLSGADGATIGDAEATITIVSDDLPPPPTISIGAALGIEEGDPTVGAAAGWFSTQGSDIVDSAGNVVKLTGVNWFGGETVRMGPDGLFTRNYKDMMDQMADLGFNTIRLPFSNDALRDGAMPNDINYSINPELQGLTSLEVIDAVVEYAGEIGLRIILDNHRNAAGDGASSNGYWYGEGYTHEEWVADWEMLAERYKDNPTVVGFDLSNEPHAAEWGSGNPATDWRLAAEDAIDAIHAINPNVLVLVEGTGQSYWWGGDLSKVGEYPIRLEHTDKLVYSPHAYPNSIYNQPWFSDPEYPDNLTDKWDSVWGYIAQQDIAPVLVGEFGSKLEDAKDILWMNEFIPYLQENNLSWTFWAWNPNSGDTGGILASDWSTVLQNKVDLLTPALGGDLSGTGTGEPDPAWEIMVDITLSAPAGETVSVAWETEDGTAIAGTDYEAASGFVTFAPGQTTKTVAITILADTLEEALEKTFAVNLSDASGGVLGNQTMIVTITDDDQGAPPVVPAASIADATVSEGDGSVFVTVSLDTAPTEAVSVDVAVAGGSAGAGDYTIPNGTLVFAAGETQALLEIILNDDDIVESSETIALALSSPDVDIADGSATVTILDNDIAPVVPTVSIADLSVYEDVGTANVVLSLDEAATSDITVVVATNGGTASGADYSIPETSVHFAAGETQATLAIEISDDTLDEADETIALRILSADGAVIGDANATVTIRDDDAPSGDGPDFNGDGIYPEFTLREQWSTGYTIDSYVVNDSASRITSGWSVEVTTDGTIANIWNARIISQTGDTYLIGNVSYNATVNAGSETAWGFRVDGAYHGVEFGDILL
ncbi:Calx-beta domain-containing protein [Acuticoccus kandeliae]|uniref:Calx-beta domain-containing protein n=1 Tax=Acuticoccus kandeliae TaxID=2073160 RepID=UPI000D3E9C96|nr:Calx-beta domain-containing protein [Acuticoccus kandeliae]